MIQYNPLIHTEEALAYQMMTLYESQPHTILVGSLGRAVLYGQVAGNPLFEFEQRGDPLVHSGIKARDIDILSGEGSGIKADGPFGVDAKAFSNPDVALLPESDGWWLVSETRHFSELLHPATMETVYGIGVLGVRCQTVPLQTHLAMYYLRGGPLRKKDDLPVALLEKAVSEAGDLPSSYFEPFRRLAQIRMRTSEAMVRTMYQRLLPPYIESCIDRFLTN